MPQPADWYADPSGRYKYRYWDGSQWTNQVSSGGPSALDPNPLDATILTTPPAPGSQATPVVPPPEQPAPQPAVHVSQSSSGTGIAALLGALVAVIAIIVLIVVLASGSDDETTETTVPTDTTEQPAETTEAPSE
jgi:hypothetical protein